MLWSWCRGLNQFYPVSSFRRWEDNSLIISASIGWQWEISAFHSQTRNDWTHIATMESSINVLQPWNGKQYQWVFKTRQGSQGKPRQQDKATKAPWNGLCSWYCTNAETKTNRGTWFLAPPSTYRLPICCERSNSFRILLILFHVSCLWKQETCWIFSWMSTWATNLTAVCMRSIFHCSYCRIAVEVKVKVIKHLRDFLSGGASVY